MNLNELYCAIVTFAPTIFSLPTWATTALNELYCAIVTFAQQFPLLAILIGVVVLALLWAALAGGGHRSPAGYTSRIDRAGATAKARMRNASSTYVRNVHDTLRRKR
jgi:hypothetical protein